MAPEVDAQIHRMWDLLPHFDGTVLRWFARSGPRLVGDYATTPKELITAMAQFRDMNFYVMLNPTTERCGVRVSAKDITHWSWLLLDIDPVLEDAEPTVALEVVLHKLSTHMWTDLVNTRRPIIIDSGRGKQAWIRLPDLVLDDAAATDSPELHGRIRRNVARAAMSHWLRVLGEEVGKVYGCHVDTSCSDLPRVMRCPGTINQKTGLVASLEHASEQVYRGIPTLMLQGLPPLDLERSVAVLPEGTPWQLVFPALNLTAKRFIAEGQEEPGRHKAAFATARALVESGLPQGQVLVALQTGNERCSEPLPIAELQRIIATAVKAGE